MVDRTWRIFRKTKVLFFAATLIKLRNWQGNYHQVFKNYVGLPYLSPYPSQMIWNDLYQHLNPQALSKTVDLRSKIGRELFGRDVWWVEGNLNPPIYEYGSYFDARKTYVRHIESALRRKRHPLHNGSNIQTTLINS